MYRQLIKAKITSYNDQYIYKNTSVFLHSCVIYIYKEKDLKMSRMMDIYIVGVYTLAAIRKLSLIFKILIFLGDGKYQNIK